MFILFNFIMHKVKYLLNVWYIPIIYVVLKSLFHILLNYNVLVYNTIDLCHDYDEL